MNLPTYNIRPTAQQEKQPQKMRSMLAQESCDIWKIFQSFLLKTSTYTIHPIYFQKYISLFSKAIDRNEIFHLKGREKLAGPHWEYTGWCSPFPMTNQ